MLFECIMSQDNYHMQLKCIEPISKRELVYRNISQIVTITRHTNHNNFPFCGITYNLKGPSFFSHKKNEDGCFSWMKSRYVE